LAIISQVAKSASALAWAFLAMLALVRLGMWLASWGLQSIRRFEASVRPFVKATTSVAGIRGLTDGLARAAVPGNRM
jgi:hypothetical protein